MKQENLLINLKKCTFLQNELVYLGFLISKEGLNMDPEKVKAIMDCDSGSPLLSRKEAITLLNQDLFICLLRLNNTSKLLAISI